MGKLKVVATLLAFVFVGGVAGFVVGVSGGAVAGLATGPELRPRRDDGRDPPDSSHADSSHGTESDYGGGN